MSTLTKILTVVFVVLAIFCSVVFIQLAVQTINWKAIAQANQQAREVAVAGEAAAKADLSASQSKNAQMQADMANLNTAFQTENASLQEQLRTAQATAAGLKASLDLVNAKLTDLEKGLSTSNELRRVQEKQLLDLQQENRSLLAKLNEAEQSIDEYVQKLQIAQQDLRTQKELVEDYRSQATATDKLPEGGAAAQSTTAQPVPGAAGPAINGTVQAVKGNLAQVNVGSADGVVKGTRFILYRNAEFVAHLDIEDVDANSSAGVLADVEKEPQTGDKATTRLQ